MSETIQPEASKKPASKGATRKNFRNFTLYFTSALLIIYLITAGLLSLFGISIWSWINVLRFILGELIILVGFLFFVIFKGLFKIKPLKQ